MNPLESIDISKILECCNKDLRLKKFVVCLINIIKENYKTLKSKNKDVVKYADVKINEAISILNNYLDDIDSIPLDSLEINCALANSGLRLKELFELNSIVVNMVLAKNAYPQFIDELYKSDEWIVRKVVAEQGFHLDSLIGDPHPEVRTAVAKHNYKLDILSNDKNPLVRLSVAQQGFKAKYLAEDADRNVRLEVAEHGLYLDELLNDKDPLVKLEALKSTLEKNLDNNNHTSYT